MNKLQKVASAISGYEPTGAFSSAKNDFYFDECDTLEKKINQVIDYAREVNGDELNRDEALLVVGFLDKELDANDTFQAFKNL